jgi:hypothetical protein
MKLYAYYIGQNSIDSSNLSQLLQSLQKAFLVFASYIFWVFPLLLLVEKDLKKVKHRTRYLCLPFRTYKNPIFAQE